jgi:hypothetical protein
MRKCLRALAERVAGRISGGLLFALAAANARGEPRNVRAAPLCLHTIRIVSANQRSRWSEKSVAVCLQQWMQRQASSLGRLADRLASPSVSSLACGSRSTDFFAADFFAADVVTK